MQSKEQSCNLGSRSISRAATAALAIAFVLAFVAMQAAIFAGTAYAQTVTFTYSYSCYEGDPGCPQPNLVVAYYIGALASDDVGIATVNSDVPGYTQPVPIDGGSSNLVSAPASLVPSFNDTWDATFENPGGSASIRGSVFGLPKGTLLLTGSFQGGAASSSFLHGWILSFSGGIDVSYINPVILANLGMAGLPNHGTGVVSDSYSFDEQGGLETFSVSVTFTPGAQCASGFGSSGRQVLGRSEKHSAGTPNNFKNFKVLHSFSGQGDGALPMGPLSLDQAGNVYGTTQQGGSGNGTVFRLRQVHSDWVLNPLYTFSGSNDGADPVSGVTIGPNGILYGTTYWQGSSGFGTAFSLKPAPQAPKSARQGWSETVLHSFTGDNDGVYPYGNLVFDQAGNLYGTTLTGGCGVVYQLTPNGAGGWTEKVLYGFSCSLYGGPDGENPYAGLVFDQLGNLYGTTWVGGNSNNYCRFVPGCGTVFQLTPSAGGWKENVIYSFQNGSDGANPSGLIVDASGNLYGTTTMAGSGSYGGTVFELSPFNGSWKYTLLYTFTGNGGPRGSLTMDQAGNLYGTTFQDGSYGAGSVFKLTPSNGAWTETDLYDFSGPDGANPMGGITFDSNGNLFGTTAYGGAYSCGVAYELTP